MDYWKDFTRNYKWALEKAEFQDIERKKGGIIFDGIYSTLFVLSSERMVLLMCNLYCLIEMVC